MREIRPLDRMNNRLDGAITDLAYNFYAFWQQQKMIYDFWAKCVHSSFVINLSWQ